MSENEHPHINQFVELPSGKRLRIVYVNERQGVVQLEGLTNRVIQFGDLKPHPTDKNVWLPKNWKAIEE